VEAIYSAFKIKSTMKSALREEIRTALQMRKAKSEPSGSNDRAVLCVVGIQIPMIGQSNGWQTKILEEIASHSLFDERTLRRDIFRS